MKRKAKRRSIVITAIEETDFNVRKAHSGFGVDVPPPATYVRMYFSQKEMTEVEADTFFNEYASKDWRTKEGTPVRNWKVLATDWIFDRKQEQKLRRRQSFFY